jgi:hypothetical protein
MNRTGMGWAARAHPTGGGPASGRRERRLGGAAAAGATALLVVLGGCQSIEPALTTPADSYQVAGGSFGPAWGGQPPRTILDDSVTIGRLRGDGPDGHLLPESGNVWPGPLPPRTTLANPDAALRGVPDYNPDGRAPTPAPTSSLPPPGPPRGLPAPSGATAPPPVMQPMRAPMMTVPPATPAETLPPRADGRVILTPNGPVVTTGGTDRVQSTISPGGQSGVAVRDGPFTTVTPIGGVPQPGVPMR